MTAIDAPAEEDLPPGWTRAMVRDVVIDARPGFASGEKDVPDGVPQLRMNNISADGVLSLELLRRVPPSMAASRYELRPGDVIFCQTNSPKLVGKTAIFELDERFVCSNHLCRLRVKPGIVDPRWLAAWLHGLWRSGYFAQRCKSWVNQATVERSVLLDTVVPFPPLDEQRRIVAALVAPLGRLEAARARLARMPQILKRYRAALLKAACEGRLVPTEAELARAEGRGYEPAEALLARMLKERQAKWEEAEEAKYAKAGKQPPPNWRAKYKEPAEPDTSELADLPEGWCWVSLDSMLREPLRNGRSVRDAPDGFPVLRLSALKEGWVDISERKSGEWTSAEAEPYLIARGDFLIARGNGSLALVGRGALVEDEPDAVAHPDTLIRVRPAASACLPGYLRIAWNRPENRSRIEATARTSAGIFKVNQEDIGATTIPLPPLAEQERIVAAVERQLGAIERVEAAAAAGLRRCEQMRQALLAKAFRGELG